MLRIRNLPKAISSAYRVKTQRFQIAGWRWSQKNAPHTFIYNRITIIF